MIKLTLIDDLGFIYINPQHVTYLFQTKKKQTHIRYSDARLQNIVKETPEEIQDLIDHGYTSLKIKKDD